MGFPPKAEYIVPNKAPAGPAPMSQPPMARSFPQGTSDNNPNPRATFGVPTGAPKRKNKVTNQHTMGNPHAKGSGSMPC